jgi:hypothetical protein
MIMDAWIRPAELESLADGACRGSLDEIELARLAVLLRDRRACQWYRDYCLLHVGMRFLTMADGADAAARDSVWRESEIPPADEFRFRGLESGTPDSNAEARNSSEEPLPVIFVSPPSGLYLPLFSLRSASSNMLFPYVAAAVILCMALFVTWTYKISSSQISSPSRSQVVRDRPTPASSTGGDALPGIEFVGQITGMVDCLWTDPAAAARENTYVPVGHTYSLASGFLQITYDSGARVILQGPCQYVVESKTGGFLSVGRLTARVEKSGVHGSAGDVGSAVPLPHRPEVLGARGERTANLALSHDGMVPTTSLAPRPLFFVRTPTSVVADLGTEFGVEVDRSGTSRAHVFQGNVAVRRADGGSLADGMTVLGENESATVEAGRAAIVRTTAKAGQLNTHGFVRQMPQRVRIKLFNTGLGLKEGDPDLHWQLVARSDDPKFKPQPAVVTVVDVRTYLPNNPARSQWISTAGNLPSLPSGLFIFRTTFELADVAPESAILRGRFLVDNHVDAIRLNGHAASVPEHGVGPPLDRFSSFTIQSGFRKGTNVLEVDVYNFAGSSGKGTPMGLLLELAGSAFREEVSVPRTPPPDPSTANVRKQKGGRPANGP